MHGAVGFGSAHSWSLRAEGDGECRRYDRDNQRYNFVLAGGHCVTDLTPW